MQTAYPTTSDLCTAAWLKQFAAQLPGYAAKYQIAEAEATALQGATTAYLDGLGEQIYRVTQAILQLAAAPYAGGWPPAAVPRRPSMRALPQQAAALGQRILTHTTYDPADGYALGLVCRLSGYWPA
ncbi:hypothetical protein QMK33_06570 [Hymenobacter sp. H14-R3]|uniref:hypothetical protein n=1 Tax=Hymenobacter sp. H14-R3 TaxID=3046308 RepID=UPI0024BACB65|nr:hypothetical protein [Hymenobacter sp. H14-R3]MDJ0364810.1 hypothetical protein [Hymenobacter sp. H14-R3]